MGGGGETDRERGGGLLSPLVAPVCGNKSHSCCFMTRDDAAVIK